MENKNDSEEYNHTAECCKQFSAARPQTKFSVLSPRAELRIRGVCRERSQALVSGGVAVRQAVDGIPIGARFSQRCDVEVANQDSRLVCELAHRVAFEIDNRAGARIARLAIIRAHDVETVLE